jgi:hypothetical protein
VKKWKNMPPSVLIELEIPMSLEQFRLPAGVQQRLQDLLDRQGHVTALTPAEWQEAEGLVTLAELLSLLRLRGQRVAQQKS